MYICRIITVLSFHYKWDLHLGAISLAGYITVSDLLETTEERKDQLSLEKILQKGTSKTHLTLTLNVVIVKEAQLKQQLQSRMVQRSVDTLPKSKLVSSIHLLCMTLVKLLIFCVCFVSCKMGG